MRSVAFLEEVYELDAKVVTLRVVAFYTFYLAVQFGLGIGFILGFIDTNVWPVGWSVLIMSVLGTLLFILSIYLFATFTLHRRELKRGNLGGYPAAFLEGSTDWRRHMLATTDLTPSARAGVWFQWAVFQIARLGTTMYGKVIPSSYKKFHAEGEAERASLEVRQAMVAFRAGGTYDFPKTSSEMPLPTPRRPRGQRRGRGRDEAEFAHGYGRNPDDAHQLYEGKPDGPSGLTPSSVKPPASVGQRVSREMDDLVRLEEAGKSFRASFQSTRSG
ncbi:hypothetical protein CTRI78_v011754 [Colletotrichum trifolii]|uniref:Transmembrane protein n=1 Tax=Colletotrichum trifolii TaxID=5466 RepID=A0A4V3HRT4_COLTR|nr:hypothetical protein CTRI78_v011754 [Colletotrichum trifolii]